LLKENDREDVRMEYKYTGCVFEVSYVVLIPTIIRMTYLSLEKLLEYANPQVLVDTQWTEDHLAVAHISASEADYHLKCDSCKIRLAKNSKEREITA
jgi:hypothetical protein